MDKLWREIKGNKVHSTAVVNWEQLEIGTGNEIGPYVCIGTDAQHIREESSGKVRIGDNNVIREYCSINLPTRFTNVTEIGSNCYFMAQTHINHDCVIEDKVILCNNVTPGGHVWIMRGAVLGFGVLVHQYQVIGSYSMIGLGTIIPAKTKITPGHIYYGNPVQQHGVNSIGMERNKISYKEMANERIRYDNILAEVKRHYVK